MNATTKEHVPDSGTIVLLFVQALPSLPGFKNAGFDFRQGGTVVTHQVTPLTSQLVAYGLLTSHFPRPWPSKYEKSTWYQVLPPNPNAKN